MEIVVYGIDPGLVDTGIVKLWFNPGRKSVVVTSTVVNKATARQVADLINPIRTKHVFIEGYRPRSHYGTDEKMVVLVRQLHEALPGSKVLLNHGVKKVIRRPLMEYLRCWLFNKPSHHQDLRSAARIALFGMVKDEKLNELLTTVVHDKVKGRPWNVLV